MDYNTAFRCALLSSAVYQDFSNIKFPALPGAVPTLISAPETGAQAAVLVDQGGGNGVGYIVFRGSDQEADWQVNVAVRQREYSFNPQVSTAKMEEMVDTAYAKQVKAVTQQVVAEDELVYPDAYAPPSQPVEMHSGFLSAYLSVRDQIHAQVAGLPVGLWRVTGHSLGGAVATLCALDVQYNFGQRVRVESYTYGSPKVGNRAFIDSYNRRVPDTWRLVYGWDIVAKLPRWWQGDYHHVSELVSLERGMSWRIISGSFEDHKMTRYISAIREAALERAKPIAIAPR